MSTRFTCAFSSKTESKPHFRGRCVGSGHATQALRAEWQVQLKQCREERGFHHERFHGLLDDGMNTVVDQEEGPVCRSHQSFAACDGPEGSVPPSCFGIEQGMVVMMIENARSGLRWELTRGSAALRRGLKKPGFRGRVAGMSQRIAFAASHRGSSDMAWFPAVFTLLAT